MFKTNLITITLLVGSMLVLVSEVNASTAASADTGAASNTKSAQAVPQHDEAGHDHSKHPHKGHNKNKVKSKSQQSEKEHDHSKHDHSKHDHKDQPKVPIVKAKPTDKDYPIGVVKWPEFKD